jgi:hypothetical protein
MAKDRFHGKPFLQQRKYCFLSSFPALNNHAMCSQGIWHIDELLAGGKAVLYMSFDVRKVAPGNDIELDAQVLHQSTSIVDVEKFTLE